MSQLKMLKNEQRNRRKAFIITTFFYFALVGGILAYTSGADFSQYLPEVLQEWLPAEETADSDRVWAANPLQSFSLNTRLP